MSRQCIGQYLSQYAFVVYISKIQSTIAMIHYLSKWFSQIYGFVIVHQTTSVMLVYFWQKALFQISDSIYMLLSGPIRWVSIISQEKLLFQYLSISGFQVTGYNATLEKEAMVLFFSNLVRDSLIFNSNRTVLSL